MPQADAAAEMKMFLAHVAALRRQQEVADLEEQRIRDEHAAELRRQQDERRCRADAARKRMLQVGWHFGSLATRVRGSSVAVTVPRVFGALLTECTGTWRRALDRTRGTPGGKVRRRQA